MVYRLGTCIPSALVCNLQKDCNDGSDEKNCVNVTCRPDEFTCADRSRCLSSIWRCDGSEDCIDGSDEKNCPPKVILFRGKNYREIVGKLETFD